MKELMKELFFRFSLETGILGTVKENERLLEIILICIATLACILGFKIYRILFSMLMFVVVTLLICFLMKERTDWGTVATMFAVLGTVCAFFAYRWHKVGGFIICALIAAAMGWIHTGSIWITFIAGLLAGIAMLVFPVIMISLMTSAWGSIILFEARVEIPFMENLSIIIFFIFAVAGFLLQMLINKKQTLFPKKYPKKVQHWMEKRRGFK